MFKIGDVLKHKHGIEPTKPKCWFGYVPERDDFGQLINKEFIDGRTRLTGQWALMTPKSWKLNGVGKLGTGYGQRYCWQDDGKWLKVEG